MLKGQNIPTIFIIFGATGDLMAKKIVPSLFHLFEKQQLPSFFKVVGVSREPMTDEEFSNHIFENLRTHKDINLKTCSAFCNLFSYQRGLFQNEKDYLTLRQNLKKIDDQWGVCANKLFYLAVSPQFYEPVFRNLAASGLAKPCSPEEGWTRVIVEKPFGQDLKTARNLDRLLGQLFKEIQIYRIDHYLAKEMVQNILAFRFSNNLFEMNWGNQLIEKVHIRLLEKIGVEDRGSFYDGVGALRDVGQNHLLQMLALVAMEHPVTFEAESIRKNRAEILESLKIPSEAEIKTSTFRAQYNNYRTIAGVASNSETETYFKIRAFLAFSRWQGVPFILESGKRLGKQIKEIEIIFRHPMPCLCPKGNNIHYKNRIIIQLEPKEGITIEFWSKKPGLTMEIEKRTFNFLFYREEKGIQYTEEYEKLLLDCIAGDQTLFTASKEVEATWKFIDPILAAWQKNEVALNYYEPDTDSVIAGSKFVEEVSVPREGLKKEIGIIGLGKMGGNLARRLVEKGWKVIGFNKSREATSALEKEGLLGAYSLEELVASLSAPRLIWLMVPAGKPVDGILFGKNGLASYLEKGDAIIDGGNSFYKDSVARFKKLQKRGIHFVDVGVSGGPEGARRGASLMIGGEKGIVQKIEPLFYDLAKIHGYRFFEGVGAGHFVKMVHNGIEYGMMQAIAEGFAILKKAKYKLNLARVAEVYNNGSVIESRLIGWLKDALELHGDKLNGVSGSVGHTGEGAWTVGVAKELKVKAKVIEEALRFRIHSAQSPSFAGRILSALREQFGGHSIKSK